MLINVYNQVSLFSHNSNLRNLYMRVLKINYVSRSSQDFYVFHQHSQSGRNHKLKQETIRSFMA